MGEKIYSEYPEVYDAFYSEKRDYESEIAYILQQFERNTHTEGNQILIVGCGPGQHAAHLAEKGFDVVAIDKHSAMVEYARENTSNEGSGKLRFQVDSLPNLNIEGEFDLILSIYNVINYLDPKELDSCFQNLVDHLTDGGVMIFDNESIPSEGVPTGMDTASTDSKEFVRIANVVRMEQTARMTALIFDLSSSEFFLDIHDLTIFDAERIRSLLSGMGLYIERYEEGYGLSMPVNFHMNVYITVKRRDISTL